MILEAVHGRFDGDLIDFGHCTLNDLMGVLFILYTEQDGTVDWAVVETRSEAARHNYYVLFRAIDGYELRPLCELRGQEC